MSRKYWLIAGAVLLVALITGGAYAARDPVAYARMATGYAAEQTCACLHISGRTMDSCLAEFPQNARGQIDVSATGNTVRAGVLFNVIQADAVYDEGFGCRLTN